MSNGFCPPWLALFTCSSRAELASNCRLQISAVNSRLTGFRDKVKVVLHPTVSRPICLAVKHPSGVQDQLLLLSSSLLVCWCGAPSLTRGRVCRLQLLLGLASAVIFTAHELSRPFCFTSFNTMFVMAIILSFSDWAPLSSCHDLLNYRCDYCERVVQRRTVCIRRLNSLTWYLLVVPQGGGALISPTVARKVCAAEAAAVAVLLRSTAAKDCPVVLWLEENILPVVVFVSLSATFSFASLPWRAGSLDS
jgi:hypothetical protein